MITFQVDYKKLRKNSEKGLANYEQKTKVIPEYERAIAGALQKIAQTPLQEICNKLKDAEFFFANIGLEINRAVVFPNSKILFTNGNGAYALLWPEEKKDDDVFYLYDPSSNKLVKADEANIYGMNGINVCAINYGDVEYKLFCQPRETTERPDLEFVLSREKKGPETGKSKKVVFRPSFGEEISIWYWCNYLSDSQKGIYLDCNCSSFTPLLGIIGLFWRS